MINDDWLLMLSIGMMALLMLWNRASIFLLKEKISVLENKIGIKGKNGNSETKQPFPLCGDEATDGPENSCESRLHIEPGADKHDGTVGVVLKRRHIGSAIPVGDFVANGGGDAQSITPNVRAKRATTAGRQARAGENGRSTTGPGLVACRWRSA